MKREPHLVLVLLFMVSSVSGQIGAKSAENNLFGIWHSRQQGFEMVLILNKDFSGEFDGEPIQFSIANNKLLIIEQDVTNQYNYLLQGNSLTLSGGDVEGSISFIRQGTNSAPSKQENNSAISKGSSQLIGTWVGNGETLVFQKNGVCNYLGQTYSYQTTATELILITSQGNVTFNYQVNVNQLVLSANGTKVVYTKSGGKTFEKPNSNSRVIAQELVGKWCYVNVYSSSTGGSSSERCITLNADGTYEYYTESSRSVNAPEVYGGTSSQGSDSGTWWVTGNRIFYRSTTRGEGSYSLEKRNHPKNRDPMIVLDGESYVTFYQKAPWR